MTVVVSCIFQSTTGQRLLTNSTSLVLFTHTHNIYITQSTAITYTVKIPHASTHIISRKLTMCVVKLQDCCNVGNGTESTCSSTGNSQEMKMERYSGNPCPQKLEQRWSVTQAILVHRNWSKDGPLLWQSLSTETRAKMVRYSGNPCPQKLEQRWPVTLAIHVHRNWSKDGPFPW